MTIQRKSMLASLSAAFFVVAMPGPGFATSDQSRTGDLSAQRRTRITVYPQNRPLGPNAKRQCQAWLEREYRVSGPVIVPRQRCWWQ